MDHAPLAREGSLSAADAGPWHRGSRTTVEWHYSVAPRGPDSYARSDMNGVRTVMVAVVASGRWGGAPHGATCTVPALVGSAGSTRSWSS